jgi:hypothetical protein
MIRGTVDIEKLTQPFPKTAVKQRTGGGGKKLDYLETHTVINRLNDATGNNWDFKVTRMDMQGDLMMVMGELTIPGLGTRTGTGVQKLTGNFGEDLVKGAQSDCLKKAATLFGVGIELYGPDYENGDVPAQQPSAGRQSCQRPANGDLVCEKCNKKLIGFKTTTNMQYSPEREAEFSQKDFDNHIYCRHCQIEMKRASGGTQ